MRGERGSLGLVAVAFHRVGGDQTMGREGTERSSYLLGPSFFSQRAPPRHTLVSLVQGGISPLRAL